MPSADGEAPFSPAGLAPQPPPPPPTLGSPLPTPRPPPAMQVGRLASHSGRLRGSQSRHQPGRRREHRRATAPLPPPAAAAALPGRSRAPPFRAEWRSLVASRLLRGRAAVLAPGLSKGIGRAIQSREGRRSPASRRSPGLAAGGSSSGRATPCSWGWAAAAEHRRGEAAAQLAAREGKQRREPRAPRGLIAPGPLLLRLLGPLLAALAKPSLPGCSLRAREAPAKKRSPKLPSAEAAASAALAAAGWLAGGGSCEVRLQPVAWLRSTPAADSPAKGGSGAAQQQVVPGAGCASPRQECWEL